MQLENRCVKWVSTFLDWVSIWVSDHFKRSEVLKSKSQRKGHKKTFQNELKGFKSRDGKIRTCDLLVPNQAR